MKRFAGKVVLITGAARGMGRSHALAFASEGASVSALDLGGHKLQLRYSTGTLGELDQTVAECRRLSRADAVAMYADIRDPAQVERAISDTVEKLGRIDVLVNNAGITTGYKPAHELSVEDWDKVMDINLKGAWLCAKYAMPHMMRRKGGRIINIASVAGLMASPGYVNYVAAKFGVVGLTKTLALELGEHNVTVNCICPTTVDTALTAADVASYGMDPEGALEEIGKLHPLGRLIQAEDVTQAVLWLASDATRNITGVALPVDAGFTTKPPL